MTDLIEFSDAEFSFRQDGTTFRVRTEVGDNKPARVVVEEIAPNDGTDMEGADE